MKGTVSRLERLGKCLKAFEFHGPEHGVPTRAWYRELRSIISQQRKREATINDFADTAQRICDEAMPIRGAVAERSVHRIFGHFARGLRAVGDGGK